MQFWKLPVEIAIRHDLTATAKVVYSYLLDRQGDNEDAWPGLREVAAKCGIYHGAAAYAIKQLSDAGLVSVERRASGGGRLSNRYRTANPDEALRPENRNTGCTDLQGAICAPKTGTIAPRKSVHSAPEIGTLCAPKTGTYSDLDQTKDSDSIRSATAGVAEPPASGGGRVHVPAPPPPPPPPACRPPMQSEGPSPYHPLHQALLDTFHLKRLTEHDHNLLAEIAVKLEAKGAQPADVPERLAAFRIKWPNLHPKPESLLANWTKLGDGPLRLASA